ncbi:MAG TPA: serine/threonine-protein kinase [Vicinamibacterales bacterium]|nr:serine/threonine-protein kinase [Vicinamibacterales bacterium]
MTAQPSNPATGSGAGTVTPERFARVRAIFEAALEQPARDRQGFVKGACVGDAVLLREVEAMLAADATGAPLLDRPASTPSSSAPEEGRFPAGTVLAGRYRILGRLGQGGMGEVYRAHDLILNQTVALKFLAPAHLSEAALARFRNEVRIARQVSHPNVCRVYDLGMVEGLHFLSMEYIDGEDLASLLRRIGRLPQDKAIEFTRKICAGLGAAHERGVLHRDLKPANIMIDGRGQPRITDFGLAGLAAEIPLSDLRSGTPAYMSPEQKAGKDVTVRSDLYSLGLVLHEMFTGKARKDTQSSPSELVKDLDPAIERLILRCLEEDPKRRPSTALNVAMALPGADPIAAALAAGETPSPEMVAASQEKEGFSVRAALLCLVAMALAVAAAVPIRARIDVFARAPLTIRPDALADRVQLMLKNIGYTAEHGPAAYGYWCCHTDAIRYVRRLDAADSAKAFSSHQPAVISFFYSQQVATAAPREVPFDPFGVETERPQRPIRVETDAVGRLLRFEAPATSEAPYADGVDWDVLFRAAHLEMARFSPAIPEAVPGVASDARTAWEGTYADGPRWSVRVEAASWSGRPVEFRVLPLFPPAEGDARSAGYARFRILSRMAGVILMAGAFVIAWRNLRQGRSEKRGAYILVAIVSVLSALEVFLQPQHLPTGDSGLPWILPIVLVWVAYIATEPYVRRHWPDSLISWSRLRSGKVHNPLVASHVLAGLTMAVIWGTAISPALDMAAGYSRGRGLASLSLPYLGSAGQTLSLWSSRAGTGLAEAALLLIAIVLFRLWIRKLWLADLAAAILIAILVGGLRAEALVLLPAWLSIMWLLRRFGLLAYLVAFMVQSTLVFAPLTTGWVGAHFLPVHLLPFLLAAWAVWVTASAGQQHSMESAT